MGSYSGYIGVLLGIYRALVMTEILNGLYWIWGLYSGYMNACIGWHMSIV